MVNTQLVATQQQLMHLQHRYDELQQGHVALMNHVSGLRDVLRRHDGAMRGVLRHLGEAGRKGRGSGYGNGIGIQDLVGNGPDDHPASPLLQVSQLLGEFSNNESLFTRDLDQLQNGMQYRNHSEYSTPSGSNEPGGGSGGGAGGLAQTPTSAVQDGMGSYGNTTGYDLDNMVYPVGQINGIDPINSEHINNIPYSFPPSGSLATQSQAVVAQGGGGLGQGGLEKALSARVGGRKPMQESIWGPHTPRILLVEDDKTCARVGCKFLESFRCHVDIARHGLEAVEKMNAVGNGDGPGGPGYDLILMDIIMPHLDGISATVCIRGGGWTGPVVAMTSNIRADDIEMYFKYGKCESVGRGPSKASTSSEDSRRGRRRARRKGEYGRNGANKHTGMNDVLPKPFTKEGMLRSLEKHLQQFKRGYNGPPPTHHASVGIQSQQQAQQQAQVQAAQQQQAQANAQAQSFYPQAQIMNGPGNPQGAMSGPQMPNMVQTSMPPQSMSQGAMVSAGAMRTIKDEASPLSKTSPASSWHNGNSPQLGQGQSPNSTAPSLGPTGSSMGPAGGGDPRFAQSGAAYSMTPGNPVSVYQQGAQSAVMPGVQDPRLNREMAHAVAQQQQQRHVEGMRQQEAVKAEGHRRMMSDMMEGPMAGEQQHEAKRQRMYAPGPQQGGGPPGYS